MAENNVNAQTLWPLHDLSERVAAALAIDYPGQSSDRISDIPSARVIRYYTTLGLIDRPAEMRGRTALYRRRHLLQIVSIKRLQAEGLSLARIQERLAGLSDARLEQIAKLPDGLTPPAETVPPAAKAARPERRFWRQVPRPVARDPDVAASPLAQSLQGIRLAAGPTLLIETGEPLDTDEIQAIQQAAEPLIRRLAAIGLLQTMSEGGDR